MRVRWILAVAFLLATGCDGWTAPAAVAPEMTTAEQMAEQLVRLERERAALAQQVHEAYALFDAAAGVERRRFHERVRELTPPGEQIPVMHPLLSDETRALRAAADEADIALIALDDAIELVRKSIEAERAAR